MYSKPQISNLLNQSLLFDNIKINTLVTLVSSLQSNDPTTINQANSILTQLKQNQSLFTNVIFILQNTTHHQTILYILLAFQQQLKNYWNALTLQQKTYFQQNFITLFNSILPTDEGSKLTINMRIKTIIVKMYILNYTNDNQFIDNVVKIAQTDQLKCENVLDLFIIMADESSTYGTYYIQTKTQQILTLAAMILKSTQQAKLKNTLIKNSMAVLERYCKICTAIQFPFQILQILLQIFKSNKFRIQICTLFSMICSQSLTNLLKISQTISTIMDWSMSIQSYRNSIRSKEDNQLLYTDLFIRAYASMMNMIIDAYLKFNPNNLDECLTMCYRIVLALSESEDKDTWVSCKQAWITYVKINKNLLDVEELSTRIIFKCQVPVELRQSQEYITRHQQQSQQQKQQKQQQTQDNLNFTTLINYLSISYPDNMYTKIWQFIQSQTFVKFIPSKFISCTHILCYLTQSLSTNIDKITNIMKLLMNISESVEQEYKKIVVVQFLNVFSFYPGAVNGNELLSAVLQDKYLENVEECILGFRNYGRGVKISEDGVEKIINKISQYKTEKLNLQESLWQIILRNQQNTIDTRLNNITQLTIGQCLGICLRNCAGLKVFGLTWDLRWDVILHIVTIVNTNQTNVGNNQGNDRRYVKKIEEIVMGLIQRYCYLCLNNSVNVKNNVLIMRVAQTVRHWEGWRNVADYFR